MDIYSKFDLHIHSYASSTTKTGDKTIVENSTVTNLNVLVKNLILNNVNIVSITDHNIFDRMLYEELKKEELKTNCIMKVLPGVEIDLEIESKSVHVICIFDDTSQNHADKIASGLSTKDSYSVDDLGSILRNIGLNTILIAHQKSDYKSTNQQKHNLSSTGLDTFYKFIGTEFFDALEIQNSKVEGILKTRFSEDCIDEFQLLVGSDCHEWSSYPAHHSGIAPASLQFMKAIPSFQGIVMAITDYSRISNSIEPPKANSLKSICLKCNGIDKNIDLSDNINVIIGDNSVGKSTLIKYLCNEVQKEAIDFLNNHGVQIITPPLDKRQYSFSGQGKIREMFESTEEKLPIRQKFIEHIIPVDKSKYCKTINDIFDYYTRLWVQNEKIENNRQNICKTIVVPLFTEHEKHYLNIEENIINSVNNFTGLVKLLTEIYDKFKSFNDHLKTIEEDDVAQLQKIRQGIYDIGNKYHHKDLQITILNEIKSTFTYSANTFNQSISSKTSTDELSYTTFLKECQTAITSICNDLELTSSKIACVWDTFNPFKIEPSTNQKGRYCFIDKPNHNTLITKDLIYNFIKRHISINKPLEDLTTSEILLSIKGKRIDEKTADNINQFVSILNEKFILEYFGTTVEIKRGNDQLNESNSAGVNALYYIDILSETFNKPIFIIDQPEDDVSQSRIAKDIIPSLKCLAKKAQVILVTHNPQLVVNLDADNVIILKKNENEINFISGALEFNNEHYSILDIVANTLDGGTEVIKKRWKRYAKTNL